LTDVQLEMAGHIIGGITEVVILFDSYPIGARLFVQLACSGFGAAAVVMVAKAVGAWARPAQLITYLLRSRLRGSPAGAV